jgi:hypothetical protein
MATRAMSFAPDWEWLEVLGRGTGGSVGYTVTLCIPRRVLERDVTPVLHAMAGATGRRKLLLAKPTFMLFAVTIPALAQTISHTRKFLLMHMDMAYSEENSPVKLGI